MAQDTSRTAYYKRATFDDGVTHTLQQLLGAALASQKRIDDRLEALNVDATSFRVITYHTTSDNCIHGRLNTYEKGAYQSVIDANPNATVLPLHAAKPPMRGTQQQEWVAGTVYFTVHKNHVIVSQSVALRATGLEQHLGWLFRSRLQLMAPAQKMTLADEQPKATKARIRKAHVTNMQLSRSLMDEVVVTAKNGKAVTKYKVVGEVLAWLERVGGGSVQKMDLEGQVFDSNLDVWIGLRYPKHQRVKPKDAIKLMDDLALALRDIDENEARLQLSDGSVVEGKELKIRAPVETSVTAGVLDETELFKGMREYLATLISSQQIEPN